MNSYGQFFHKISGLPTEKIVHDVLDENKIHDQIKILMTHTQMNVSDLKGKKVLEIGSGMGIFVSVTRKHYEMESFGIEPSEEGFNSSFQISHDILKHYELNSDIIIDAKGENIPFEDNSFDIVFSSTVIEHVDIPYKVLQESLRVLKPGGYLHFVYPNHHSFFDGHYCIFHPPLLFRGALFPWMVKYVYRRDPAFAKTLRTELNVWSTQQMLRKLNKEYSFYKISLGTDIFLNRMNSLAFGEYAGLGMIRRILLVTRKLGINSIMAYLLVYLKFYDPIILTLRKS